MGGDVVTLCFPDLRKRRQPSCTPRLEAQATEHPHDRLTGREHADVRNRSGRRHSHVQDLQESMLAARGPAPAEHAEHAGR